MPYEIRGKCVYKKDTGKKVGCTDGDVKKYLAALRANTNENKKRNIMKARLEQIIKEETADEFMKRRPRYYRGLLRWEPYIDVATKAKRTSPGRSVRPGNRARGSRVRVKELINLAATKPKIRSKLLKYMDGPDRMKVRALRKKLGLFQRSTQGPEDLPKGRPELRAIQDIEQGAGRVSAYHRGEAGREFVSSAQRAGEERAYGLTSSDAPIRRSVYEPRQEDELERIKVGTAPLGLMPGGALATTAQRAGAESLYALMASEGGPELAKQIALGLGKQALSKGAGVPTSTKSLARKVLKKSIDPKFREKVKSAAAIVRRKRREPAASPAMAGTRAGGAFKGHRMMEENKMKITKQQLKHIIKEEISKTIKEYENWEDPRDAAGPGETGRHMSREHLPEPFSDMSLTQIDDLLDELGYMVVPKEFFEMSAEEREDFEKSKSTPAGTVRQVDDEWVTEPGVREAKKKVKNKYAVCTASIAKTAGTSKRSEWTVAQKKRYERCKKEV